MTRVAAPTYRIVLLIALALPSLAVLADRDRGEKNYSMHDVRGRYAFSFQGEIVGVGTVAATGVIHADGKGHIPSAVRTISVGGAPAIAETFTCTYSVQADGTGSAECPLDNPAPGFPAVEYFDFAIAQNGDAFHFVGKTPGVVVLGSGEK